VLSTAMLSFIVNVYLNLAFYPSLVEYQAGSMAGRFLNHYNTQKYPVKLYRQSNWPLEFYLNAPVTVIDPDTIKTPPKDTFMLYIPAAEVKELDKMKWNYSQVYSVNDYPITRLKLPFLNVRTRKAVLNSMLLVTVNQPVPQIMLKRIPLKK